MPWSEKANLTVRLYSGGSVLEYLRISNGADKRLSETHRIVTRGHLVYRTAAYFGILSYFVTHRSFWLLDAVYTRT
jgi:hypothetical protein